MTTTICILATNYTVDLFGYYKLHARELTFYHKTRAVLIKSDSFAPLEPTSHFQFSHVPVFLSPGKPSLPNLHLPYSNFYIITHFDLE